MWESMLRYVKENIGEIVGQMITHVTISMVALVCAIVGGCMVGYIAYRYKENGTWFLTPFELLRVIPSLAFLLLMIPLIGVGKIPAILALMVLAIPPIMIHTYTGLKEVNPIMIEAGKGMGLSDDQLLRKVIIPLAFPSIFAGIRTALIEVLASATLAAKIGAGGLGEIIFTGLGLYRMDLLVLGGMLVSVLSLSLGLIYDQIVKRIITYK